MCSSDLPRPRDEPLFGPRQVFVAFLQGASILVAVLGLYVWALGRVPEAEARGAAFVALIVGNLVLALTDAAPNGRLFAREHRIFWGISAAVMGALVVIFASPALARLFLVAPPSMSSLVAALGVAMIGGGWTVVMRPRARLALARGRG